MVAVAVWPLLGQAATLKYLSPLTVVVSDTTWEETDDTRNPARRTRIMAGNLFIFTNK